MFADKGRRWWRLKLLSDLELDVRLAVLYWDSSSRIYIKFRGWFYRILFLCFNSLRLFFNWLFLHRFFLHWLFLWLFCHNSRYFWLCCQSVSGTAVGGNRISFVSLSYDLLCNHCPHAASLQLPRSALCRRRYAWHIARSILLLFIHFILNLLTKSATKSLYLRLLFRTVFSVHHFCHAFLFI